MMPPQSYSLNRLVRTSITNLPHCVRCIRVWCICVPYICVRCIHVQCIVRGSHGLSAQSARRTKSRGPKGLHLEVRAGRAPRHLVFVYFSLLNFVQVVASVMPLSLHSLADKIFCSTVWLTSAAAAARPQLTINIWGNIWKDTVENNQTCIWPFEKYHKTSPLSVGCEKKVVSRQPVCSSFTMVGLLSFSLLDDISDISVI